MEDKETILETVGINEQLDDDCLGYILRLLPIVDRLNAEQVCKRWHLITTSLWRSYQTFDITDDLFRLSEDEKDYNAVLLKQVFMRCAPYVVVVNISLVKKRDQMILFSEPPRESRKYHGHKKVWEDIKEVLPCCSKIEELTVDARIMRIDDLFLSHFLSKYENIRFLHFECLYLEGETTFRIPCKNLETLIVFRCSFHIESLNWQALCESTKLKNLMLCDLQPRGELQVFEHFRKKKVEQLKLEMYDHTNRGLFMQNPLGELNDPLSLRVFSSPIFITAAEEEDMVNTLTHHCQNLVALDLSYTAITDDHLYWINASLPKLVCLTINFCQTTDRGIRNVNKNLKSLVAWRNEFTDDGIRNLLQRAESLEELDLCESQVLSHNVTTIVIEAMKSRLNRKNFTPLEIHLGGSSHVSDEGIDWDDNPFLKFDWKRVYDFSYDVSWPGYIKYIHL